MSLDSAAELKTDASREEEATGRNPELFWGTCVCLGETSQPHWVEAQVIVKKRTLESDG